jgi:hypothetical protein
MAEASLLVTMTIEERRNRKDFDTNGIARAIGGGTDVGIAVGVDA